MKNISKEILSKIEQNGFEAYIVGGFVRDFYMKKKSYDVDICTNAKPKDLNKIFPDASIPTEKYGSVTLYYKDTRFEITTYRREIKYEDNRRPAEIEYVDSLEEDLKRRDFTINTLCMDSKGKIIDLLNGRKDIDNKIIRMVNDPYLDLKNDVLRILRAVRFATVLNFKLDDDIIGAINEHRSLLTNLSYTRKKDELVRILASSNTNYGVKLICDLKLHLELEIPKLGEIKLVDDILGIWAQLDVLDIYPFTKTEKEMIIKIKELLKIKEIDNKVLYDYDFYVVSIAAAIKGIKKKVIVKKYNQLPIKRRKDIKIDALKICKVLNKNTGPWIKEIINDLETKILNKQLINDEKKLVEYIINNY